MNNNVFKFIEYLFEYISTQFPHLPLSKERQFETGYYNSVLSKNYLGLGSHKSIGKEKEKSCRMYVHNSNEADKLIQALFMSHVFII